MPKQYIKFDSISRLSSNDWAGRTKRRFTTRRHTASVQSCAPEEQHNARRPARRTHVEFTGICGFSISVRRRMCRSAVRKDSQLAGIAVRWFPLARRRTHPDRWTDGRVGRDLGPAIPFLRLQFRPGKNRPLPPCPSMKTLLDSFPGVHGTFREGSTGASTQACRLWS